MIDHDREHECALEGHYWTNEIHCDGCGGYLGTFCDYCGAEVSAGYNVGTCACPDPAWAEEAVKDDDV